MFLFELLRDYMVRQSSYDISDMAMLRAFTLPVSTTKYGQLQYTYAYGCGDVNYDALKKEFNHRNKKNLLSKDLDQFLKNISTKLEPFYAPR